MKAEIFKELQEILNQHKQETLRKRKEVTPNFNLVELISPKELQLSKIIAEFLNPKGTHEQGRLFLDTFLNEFFHKLKVPKGNITIKRELSQNVNGQIDIVIDFNNEFGIAIENKPFAEDQDQQIIRYVEYLENNYSDKYLMIYLSELGQSPSEKSLPQKDKEKIGAKFSVLSYENIRDWLIKCSEKTKENNAERLTILILEIIEYINLEFLKTNQLNKKMLGKAIKNNILEAFEIKELWQTDKNEFNKIWNETINDLVNKTLPKLVFEELKKRKIIDNNWIFIEGDFSISKKSAKGFHIKKKEWRHFSYSILRNEITKIPKGSCWFFPAISSKQRVENYSFDSDLQSKYCNATNTNYHKEQWAKPSTIWWSDFPEKEFQIWNYEQWSEIKENGKTILYVTDFLEKIIKVSETDIEKIENEIQ